ncbi:MAG: hypothetical protein A3C80_01195 [Candidatus Ryanbacteria bacterium RIFCSPHIGHO2_02_FULL_45_43]|uniref:Aminotransferase n=1 Tax=Candidatus Ryanbacteria bacterium RIFCSPHIGHO2_01_45_13 TaxID=1802112 RepID=A0A1G2FXR1_9BACT|nr:MAG: hypothetical protein A2718_03425 [Candidatus Ryanbacteria bacterium RIFCSPHIGHO2_01_FULL_44_130]OGZ42866.1 MAG: hypothetical protein A2W41_01950 [Candidatus Ryanbacteria bacterium RIFCSPHIGHO2_01_45_13]OGZ48140.1 MAG: hypothetical protein A3C80_01195 [Candidatus Ryanbacteria bacterium RIFCSPHIGHO2_02_FULL_45_43]OGZ49788.1 MAG: hypothetical protein A3E55_01020 [Candidatus Ryanbacteria bacterium RIFCSPHIGHO2_12_FULL_44_20]OGZ51214.1 MAG: hypothetical protein A3A17_04230 [Candidatus Ryanba
MIEQKNIESPSFFIGLDDKDIISFGSGQPDLSPPKEVYNILPTYSAFRYGRIEGDKELRIALAAQYPKAAAENFVITNGASEALDLCFRVLAGMKGKKKILLPSPYYYSYPFIVKFAGLESLYTKLKAGRIDINDFSAKIKKCAAVLINSPSNPTGRIEAIGTLKEIERITKQLGIYVISDEVYKDLIYERENYLIKGPRVITVNSFSKTFAMCGLRVGYLYSLDADFIRRVIEMKTHVSMNTNILAQAMALEATRVPRSYVDSQIAVWRERRDFIYDGLKSIGLDLWKPEGAFYVFPKVKNASKAVSDLFYKQKVIVYDGAWFGSPGRIRLSYALDKEKIREGIKRINSYLTRQ